MIILEDSQMPSVDQIVDTPMEDPIKILKVCQELQVLCEKEGGTGISAIQAGIPWKLFLVKGDGSCPLVAKNEYGYFVNCEYQPVTEERVVSLERCLSIRSSYGQLRSFHVERYKFIKIIGHKLNLLKGLKIEELDVHLNVAQQCILFQHEIDYNRGRLISDIGKEVFIW